MEDNLILEDIPILDYNPILEAIHNPMTKYTRISQYNPISKNSLILKDNPILEDAFKKAFSFTASKSYRTNSCLAPE